MAARREWGCQSQTLELDTVEHSEQRADSGPAVGDPASDQIRLSKAGAAELFDPRSLIPLLRAGERPGGGASVSTKATTLGPISCSLIV